MKNNQKTQTTPPLRPWLDAEIALLGTKPDNVLAAELNRSYTAVRVARLRRNIPAFKQPAASAPVEAPREDQTYEEDRTKADAEVWRNRFYSLETKYARALQEASVVQQLVSEISELAPRSYSPLPSIIVNREPSSGSPQTAVLQFSDTHIGKVVTLEQTLGFGQYNFPIFLARLKYLEESILSIIQNHMTVPIDELVVAMLGDMLDGKLIHSIEAGQRNTVFTQFYMGGHAIAQFFRVLAAHVPKVRIKTVVGNHPRWDSQKKMPTENRFSNLDMFLYALIEALTRDITNIEWDLNQQPFALFDVKGFVFHAAHGDHLRGGDKALGIPNHAIGREVSTKTQLFAKHERQAPHFYLSGHLHRGITIPHALGEVMINGGFPGLDNYALEGNFNPVDPIQRFFFVHPKYGKTAEYWLNLKFAEVTDAPYVLPKNFPCQ